MSERTALTVAMLLSCDSFESFYGAVLRLDKATFLSSYRNDWSWYYARGLVENGIRPILYLPSIAHSGLHLTAEGIAVRFLRFDPWYRPFASLRRAMRITRWTLYGQERISAVAFLSPLRRVLAEDGADILYMQEYWGGRFDHLAHRIAIPLVAADHGGLSRGVVKSFKRAAFARAATIYCQTPDECAQVEWFGGRASLQPNGVDVSTFVPPQPGTSRQRFIVTVARLTDKQKRTSDLIRALAHLPDDWTLRIVGTGPDRADLEALAQRCGVAHRVTFLGFLPRDEIRTLNQHCGAYAMPSANEGMCLAVLEAMSCAAPVVLSRIRAFESLVQHGVNGLLFEVGDVKALAGAIEAAWHDRATLGPAAARSVCDQFDARKLYRRLADSLRAAAKRPAAAAAIAKNAA